MAITLEQIAQLAGVSRSTASRVLNGHPNVSAEARERVRKVMREQGYEPNPTARALANRRQPEPTPEDAMKP
jgi:LacI family transcriptional regulator